MMYSGSSRRAAPLAAALFLAVACGAAKEPTSVHGNPAADKTGDGGAPAGEDAAVDEDEATDEDEETDEVEDTSDAAVVDPASCGIIKATVRDFTPTHPDFESSAFNAKNPTEAMMAVTGLVEAKIGFDHKPVFSSAVQARPQITSESSFASWYNDDAQLNRTIAVELALDKQPDGSWAYDSSAFFPIDTQGFGNFPDAAAPHNYHFTTEIHLSFKYQTGQSFTFRGDDDLWLFVGGTLAVDLGGLHLPVSGTLDMDALAKQLDLAPGESVTMDIFHAERHTGESNFHLETNIQCFVVVPVL